MHDPKSSYIKYQGLTLIELLFSLMLSILILSCVLAIYLTTNKKHLSDSTLQIIQENMRIVEQILASKIRQAGHGGCSKKTVFSTENFIEPYQSSDNKAGTDGITIRYAEPLSAMLMESMTHDNELRVSADPSFSIGDSLLISDCESAEHFTVLSISTQADHARLIITDPPLSKHYLKNSEVSQWMVVHLSIIKTSRKTDAGLPIYALYMKTNAKPSLEIAEGIHDMQITYSVVEQNNVVDLKSSLVTDWSAVKGVSIELTWISLTHFSLEKKQFIYAALH